MSEIAYKNNMTDFNIPYASNGLFAMWDGIWNAGKGIHDDDTRIWRDLVGSNDLNLIEADTEENKGHWTDNSYFSPSKFAVQTHGNMFVRHGDISQDFVDHVNSARLTVEICFKTTQTYFHNPTMFRVFNNISPLDEILLMWSNNFSFRSEGWNISANRGVVNFNKGEFTTISYRSHGLNSYAEAFNLTTGKSQTKTSVTSSASPMLNQNGYITINGLYENNVDNLQGDVFCIRMYDRVLDEQEIIKNYEIDKLRFNS